MNTGAANCRPYHCVLLARSFNGTCPEGFTERSADDGHECSDGVCDAADCCQNACHSVSSLCSDAGKSTIGSYDQSGCGSTPDTNSDGIGDNCDAATCCMTPCNAWSGTCTAGEKSHAGHVGCGARAAPGPVLALAVGRATDTLGLLADGTDAQCQERCCQQTCHEMGVECAAGWTVRGSSDGHRPNWSSDANWPQSECCHMTCEDVGFAGGDCPAMTILQSSETCTSYGVGGVTDAASATCSADRCCTTTCGSTQSTNGLTCPAGKELDVDETCFQPGDPHSRHDSRLCTSTADSDGDGDDDERGCCFTPYVVGALVNTAASDSYFSH